MGKQPNFLLFITDQQRFDHLGCMGNPLLHTPHIDALAHGGTILERFYVASPVCQPNRASMMTGRMPSLHGVRHNGIPLDLDATTFVHQLRDAGYHTALIGKSHLQNFSSLKPAYPPPAHDADLSPPRESHAEAWRKRYDDAAYGQEYDASWADSEFEIGTPFYGFDHVRLCTSHGDTVGGHYRRWFETQRGAKSQSQGGRVIAGGPEHALAQSRYGSPQTYQTAVPVSLHPTTYVAQETINYLQAFARDKQDAPFFIQCAFPDPHHPFAPPGKYWDMYDEHDVTLPASFYATSHDQTPPLALIYKQSKEGGYPSHWTTPFIAEEMPAKEMVAKTYGMITLIDDAVGQVLAVLEQLGLDADTVVCFLSDHGDWLGSHGLFLKGPLHYQSLIRIPFVWRDPESAYNSGRQDVIGSTLDIGATILARAGIAPFNGNQGRSLLPALRGEVATGRQVVLIEQTTQYLYLGFERIIRIFSLVSRRWRVTVWEGEDWGELYDLEQDPEELDNLWDRPELASKKSELLLRMVHQIQSLNDNSPYPMTRA